MSSSSGPVTVGDTPSRTSEATGRSSSASPSSNTRRRGSTSTSQAASMSVQRSQSINIRELFNASNPENDFYVPEVFDAMDEGMELEEAFIQAQRAALAAINDAALAKAIQESQREAALPSRTQRSRSVEPSLATVPKYALVSPSELGCPQDRNRSRSGSGSSASTASSSGSGSTSAPTTASSALSSSLPKTGTPIQHRPPAVKLASTPAVITASSSATRSSSTSRSPPKVPVIPASAPTSSLSTSRPTASSTSKAFANTPTATASAKAAAIYHHSSNQPSASLGSTSSTSGSKSISINPASESGHSRKGPGVPSSTAPVAQPVPIINKSTPPSTSPLRSSPLAMALRPSSSPSAKDLASGVMSSTSISSSELDNPPPHRQACNIRQRLKCSRCSGSARVKCRCPLSYLLAVEQCLAAFDKEFVTLVTGDDPSKVTTDKQRQLFLARVLLRNEMATRPFESIAVKTLDSLQKSLAGLKDVASAASSSEDSDSSDSPEFDYPSSLDLHLYLQSLLSGSFLPSFIHFFLSHPNAQDWMKFADLYIGILTFLRRMVECGGGSILSERLVMVDRRYHNSSLTSSATSSIWDVVLNRLERQTRPELIKATTAIKFGGTLDKVNRMCDGIMWLVLQDLTD